MLRLITGAPSLIVVWTNAQGTSGASKDSQTLAKQVHPRTQQTSAKRYVLK